MNRTELVDAVATSTGLDKKQSEAAVMAFADSVMAETKAGAKVSIFGFGTFTPTARAARKGRNPQTGAEVNIAASKGVRFAPASAFKATLNTRGGAKKATAATKATASTKAPAKKAPAKKAPAKKAPAKKAPAKKAGASRTSR